ncbi:hypothetical protein PTKIN_Ptkin09bG0265300 [Pterospermum kingtungense]
MAKLGYYVYVLIFFHLLQFGYGDVLETHPFNVNQQSLLKYLSLRENKFDLPALYAFGDSFVDDGNNRVLNNGGAAYLPYGIDFDGKPTGRATNGRVAVDFIATVAGLPYPPPILGMSETERKTTRTGVNYGSGSSGILPENGRFLHMKVINLLQQVDLFENATVKNLKGSFNSTDSFNQYLSKSIFFIHIGGNDFGLTYEKDMVKKYSVDKYARLLIKKLSKQLERLYKLGARKFLVCNIAALGCQPFNINTKNHTGPCAEEVNQHISVYNKLLPSLLKKLESTLSGSKFVHGDIYKVFQDAITSPASYGFKDVSTSCCIDRKGTRINTCAPNVAPCEDRKAVAFFDPFHPSESMHFLWARRFLKDSSVCSPMTLIQLMQA